MKSVERKVVLYWFPLLYWPDPFTKGTCWSYKNTHPCDISFKAEVGVIAFLLEKIVSLQ